MRWLQKQVPHIYIPIRPDLRGFHKTIQAELEKTLGPIVKKLGEKLGQDYGDGFGKGLGDPVSDPLDRSTKKQQTKAPKQGDKVAGAFARGFQRRLKTAFENLPDAKITADSSQADKKIAELRARMQQLSEKTIGVDVDSKQALAELESIRADLSALGDNAPIEVKADVAAALAQIGVVQAEVDKLSREKAEVKVDVDKTASSRIATIGRAADATGRSLVHLAASSRGLSRGFFAGLRWTAIAGGLISIAGGAAAAASGVIQLSAALAPAAGILAAWPGAVAGAVVAMGTLKLALSGVSDAFKAAMGSDAKKFEESLKGLSPAARSVATELHKLRPELLGIRSAAQGALFTPLKGQLTAVAKALIGPVKSGVQAVAAQFGAGAVQVARFARESQTVAALRAVFGTVASSIRSVNPVLQPILAGFRDLSVAALPTLQSIAQSAGQVGAKFGTWLQALSASGRVQTILDNALATLRQLGTVASNAGGIIKSVLSAASSQGSSALGVIGQALGQLNAFLKTAAGQSALQGIFSGLAAVGKALSPVIQALVKGVGMLAGPLGRLAQILGPILTTAINALAPALAALEPGLSAIFTALGQGISQIAPLLAPVGQALAQIGVAIAPILPLAGQLISALVTALLPVVRALTPVLGLLVGAIGQIVGAVTPLLAPIGQLIAQLVTALTPILQPLINLTVQLVGAFLQLLTPLLPLVGIVAQLVVALTPLIGPITQLTSLLISILVPILRVLVTVIVAVVQVIAAVLIPVVRVAAVVLGAIFTAVAVVIRAIGTAAQWVWGVIKVAFAGIVLAGKILFAVIATLVIAPILISFRAFAALGLWLWRNALQPAFSGIGAAALWLWRNAILPAWNGIKAAISAAYNATIKPVLSALNAILRNVIAPVFRWIYNSVIKPLWSAVGSVVRSVWDSAIKPAFNALKSGLSAVRNAFSTAVSAIGRIWKGIESATKKPVQFVVDVVYNNGIRSVWNKVAGLVKLPALPAVKFATGGIFPGYTPGRDPYTMPMAAFSGGEAVMRPEFTRAVGPDFVYTANAVAAKRGVSGIRDFLANGDLKFSRGGILPGRPVAAFADGGIIGGILGAVKHAGSLVVRGASSLLDAGASTLAKKLLHPILSRLPGADSTWAKAILGLPKQMIDGFVGWLAKAVDPKLGGDATGVVAAAKKYVGIGDDRGPNNNIFSRAWGMPGAPWCFAAGTLVDTPRGLVPIEDIEAGDEVLTPSGVVAAASTLLRREKPLLNLVALGVPDTLVTADHPYWAMVRPGMKKEYLEPAWVRAGDLRRGDMIALPVPADGAEQFDPDLAYVLGMYVADGHRLHRDKAVQFSDAASERERILSALKRSGYRNVRVHENRTCLHFTVYDRRLYELCGRFGDLAAGKRIAGEVFGWMWESREALIEGYLAGDGSFHERQGWQATTVSRSLAIGLGKLVRSLGFTPNVRVVRDAQTMTIEGREVHTQRQYQVVWKPWPIEKGHKQFFERDGYLWVPVRSVVETGRVETVYDITVPGEHAFVADGAAVHNCAMFVSTAIKDAHAQKHYPGYPTAAVAGFNNAMRHVPVGSGRPGDLGVYSGGGHVNIIEKKAGSGYMTIGGNQNALVQRGVRGGQTSMLRPSGFAKGGILGSQAARIFGWEAARNADPHEMQTPLVRLMRSLPSGQMGNVARAIVSKNLTITNAGLYDNGGMLAPGLNLAYNATRRPEPVLSGSQWDSLAASRGGDSYTSYNVYPQRAEISTRDLEAMQRRQEALARTGRPS